MRGLGSPPCAVSDNQLSWHVQEEGVFPPDEASRRHRDCLPITRSHLTPNAHRHAGDQAGKRGSGFRPADLCIACGGRRFQMLKFRTVVHDPEHATPTWAQRTTQLGEFLRYTRIEDLPQLINVLRGEMSIIDRDARSSSFLD